MKNTSLELWPKLLIDKMRTSLTLKLLAAILVLGFLSKVLLLLLLPPPPFTGDAIDYETAALHILYSSSYPDITINFPLLRAPIYPLFLSGIFWFFPKNYFIVKLFHILFSTISTYFFFKIGEQIFSKKVGLLAAFIFTFHPYNIVFCLNVQTEPLAILLLTSSIYLLLEYDRTERKNKTFLLFFSGVLIGIGTLTRPQLILLVPIFVFWMFLKNRKLNEVLKPSFVLIFSFFLTISPWVLRNYFKFDEFIYSSDGGGFIFYVGNSHEFYESFTTDDPERYHYLNYKALHIDKFNQLINKFEKEFNYSELTPKARERLWYGEGFDYIRNNTEEWLKLMGYKFVSYFRPWLRPMGWPTSYVWGSGILTVPLFILGFTGIIIALRSHEHRHITLLFLLFFLSGVITHTVLIIQTRYRWNNLDIFLYMFAAHAFFSLSKPKFREFIDRKLEQ